MNPKAITHIIESEVLVIGAGLSGAIAAVKADELGRKVVIVDKGYLGWGSQTMNCAGANINVRDPSDDMDRWMKEFIERAEYLNHQEWVKIHLEETYSFVEELDRWGTKYGEEIFPMENNQFLRIQVHGDRYPMSLTMDCFGAMITLRKVILDKKIEYHERIVMSDLITDGQQVIGAVGFNYRNGETYLFRAKAVILAAGGTSFKFHEGRKNNTGEVQAMAYEAGAQMRNLEQGGSRPVGVGSGHTGGISGVGCCVSVAFGQRLVNRLGDEFMWKYDEELGSRNYQSQTAFCRQEVEEGRGPIFVDYSQVPEDKRKLLKKLKTAKYKLLENSGIDPFGKIEHSEDFARIASIHGSSTRGGGVDVDTTCATSIPGLYASGDTAPAPLTGGHTFGGTNLAWALLSGFKVGKFASEYAVAAKASSITEKAVLDQAKGYIETLFLPLSRTKGISPDEATWNLQEILVPFDVVHSHKDSLENALADLDRLEKEDFSRVKAIDYHDLLKSLEYRSMMLIAKMILKSCLFREESRGQAVRRDFPMADNINWMKWVMIEKKNGDMKIYSRDIPTPYITPPPITYTPVPKGR